MLICAGLSAGCGDNLAATQPPDATRLVISDARPDGTNPPWPADVVLPPEFDFPPWLNMPAPGQIVVSWRTVKACTGVVRLGPTRDYGRTERSSESRILHHVDLGVLAPATAYHYEVELDGSGAVRKGVFVTPGAPSWRFAHVAEFHAASDSIHAARFGDTIRAFRPHVLVESGDMLNSGDSITDWRSYMRTSAPWISNVILLPAGSNHVNGAAGSSMLRDLYVLPNNERWYTTRYGAVEFFSLDSTYDRLASDVSIDEPAWLAEQAALAHDGDGDPTFVVAAWHYPACSSNQSSRAAQRAWVMTNFVDTLRDAGGVDLLLVGHDKYYERSELTDGIVQIQSNAGRLAPGGAGGNHEGCTPVVTRTDTRSLTLFEVSGMRMVGKAVDEEGLLLDSFVLTP